VITIEFEIPKNTTSINPKVQVFDLGVNARVIKSIEVLIPDGHKGLAYLRVYMPGRVLIPEEGSSVKYIHGNDKETTTTVNKRIEGPPYKITCEGYNLDARYNHSFTLNIEV
jgi:hypothetical protein